MTKWGNMKSTNFHEYDSTFGSATLIWVATMVLEMYSTLLVNLVNKSHPIIHNLYDLFG